MNTRTRFTALAAMSAAVVCLSAGPAAAAIAAPRTVAVSSAAAAQRLGEARIAAAGGKACLIQVTPKTAAKTAKVAKPTCYADYAKLKTALTKAGKALVFTPTTTAARSLVTAAPAKSAKSAENEYVLNTDFADVNYGGNSYSYVTTDSSMCAGNVFSHSSEPSGWNDRISSFNAYGNCSEKLWQNTNFSGDTYGYSGGAKSLGSFNDEASSERVQ